jgi:hypothetical protein
MMNRFAFALGTLFCATMPGVAAAQAAEPDCAPRGEIVAKLAQDFKERQQAIGVVNEQAVLEIYVSGAGTWTIIATDTGGNSCVVSAGKDWDSNDFIKGLDTGLHRPAVASPENNTAF